ncbi:hypothetical protein ACH95_17175 [Bacillus glycinifermentans]|uniref:hypothetical protein n=1 Tax=Bacillus TaxID=1386 RepID=UPI0006529AF1|nr:MULTISPECIES: hypothetical protein [Bacillus]ATH94511.1 hypothetical protein COP00_19560 [Bacillus glycinifermentans]AVB10273.1 hypothetical protein C3438_12625 [Bacillus velezensis]KMM56658.1 hypothetical protein ACH95_17175 [Bacillus glycinifermentans]MBU8788855.1 hypothetical protein [Bacillus glycinifermentans]MDR4955284.1 hypothetical protein [Bacillus sonorensis]
MDKHQMYSVALSGAIFEVFNKESEHFIEELTDVDLTEFFTAANTALLMIFNELTGEKKNAIEFTHVLNGLAVQKTIENVKEKETNEQSKRK